MATPESRPLNIMRINDRRGGEKWWEVDKAPDNVMWNHIAWIPISDDGLELTFDPETGCHEFAGGHSKFTIR